MVWDLHAGLSEPHTFSTSSSVPSPSLAIKSGTDCGVLDISRVYQEYGCIERGADNCPRVTSFSAVKMADDSSSDDETLNQGIDNTLASGYQLLPSFENAIDLSSDEDEEDADTAADGLPKSDGHVRDDESQFEERVLEADDIVRAE